ncbi:tetratricopeptide repeat protein [Desulfogranum japonicum]|uniref:tetratricopeptide repeat protein n=1 Tax=Desulfogranum japonicum TaxID=231447 RepID=UPI00041D5744|nr:tetratricopeptide repeat protein [Desulfogranum japonicum]
MLFYHKKPLFFTIFCAVCLLLCNGCTDDTKKLETHYKKAQVYLNEGKDDEAIIEFRNVVQLDPKHADARYQLGLLYLKDQKFKQAFGELQRAASLNPDNLDARIKTAEFLLLSRQKDDARTHIEFVLQKEPENVDALALLSNLELMDGQNDKAMQAINKAISIAKENPRLYLIQGRAYAALKKMDNAEASFKRAVELNKENQGTYITLVSFYVSSKQYDKAKTVLHEMAKTFPDSPQPYLQLASIYLRENNVKETEQYLNKAMEIAPEDANLKVAVADFLIKQYKPEEAEKLYIEAIDKAEQPENVEAKLANFYFDQRRYDEAQKKIDSVLASNPKNGIAKLVEAKFDLKEGKFNSTLDITTSLIHDYPNWGEVYFIKAMAHYNLKETELAKNGLLEAIAKDPVYSKAHSLLSLLLLQEGDFEGAKKEAATALKIDTRNFQAALTLAKSALFSKEFENAEKMFSELDQKVPDNVEILGNLGLAYIGLKQPEKAKEAFEKILALQPGNAKAFIFILQMAKEEGISKEALLKMTQEQLEKAPDSASLNILFGDLMMGAQQFDEALKAYKKAQELAPQNPAPYSKSALIYRKQGKTDQALSEYQGLLQKNPDSVPVLMALGTLYEQTGKPEEAKETYKKLLSVSPNFAPAANNLAWMIAESADPDLGEALRLAMIAKQEQPDSPNIIDTLGWVHYKRGSFSLARNEFNQAVAKDEDNPILRYHLALALNAEGKRVEAIQELKKSLESDKPFPFRKEAEQQLKEW